MEDKVTRLRESCAEQVAEHIDDEAMIEFLADELVAGYTRLGGSTPSELPNRQQRLVAMMASSFSGDGVGRSSAFSALFSPLKRSEVQLWEREVDLQIIEINTRLGPRWKVLESVGSGGYKLAFRIARGKWEPIPRRGLAEIVLNRPPAR